MTEINPQEPVCSLCGSEVIPMHEYGKEGPQRLICCRLIPMCGAQYSLTGRYIFGTGPYTEQETTNG